MSIETHSDPADRLEAPHPLPYISRRSLERVKHPVDPPERCRDCGTPVDLECNDVIYNSPRGDWPYIYICHNCESYVGLHPYTNIPLGTLADGDTRRGRLQSKAMFTRLTEAKQWRRTAAYTWLARELELHPRDCHFGMFNAKQCAAALEACSAKLAEHRAMEAALK